MFYVKLPVGVFSQFWLGFSIILIVFKYTLNTLKVPNNTNQFDSRYAEEPVNNLISILPHLPQIPVPIHPHFSTQVGGSASQRERLLRRRARKYYIYTYIIHPYMDKLSFIHTLYHITLYIYLCICIYVTYYRHVHICTCMWALGQVDARVQH